MNHDQSVIQFLETIKALQDLQNANEYDDFSKQQHAYHTPAAGKYYEEMGTMKDEFMAAHGNFNPQYVSTYSIQNAAPLYDQSDFKSA